MNYRAFPRSVSWLCTVTAIAAACAACGGCVPLVVGSAAVGAGVVVTDPRSADTQVDDRAIELRGTSRVRDMNGTINVTVTSYNRQVLLTGTVDNAADRQRAEDAVRKVDKVRSVVNAIHIGPPLSFKQRSNDTGITALVRNALLNGKKIPSAAFKVVTEANTVYLMGLATQDQIERATQEIRNVSGVDKVVRLTEVTFNHRGPARGASVSDDRGTPLPPINQGSTGGSSAETSPVR
ncbi:MAG: BON domain-containing protein [Burkholderiaceae bacterium]|jgi:osmotically-inducible protein OsmY|nr:BON domain-containing protein [Burkholderiaceae bacterium]